MKKAKQYLLKRILCFLLVGCITSTSVFLSYSSTLTVRAETTVLTIIERAIITIAGIAGYAFFPQYSVPISIAEVLGHTGVSIQEYYTDNGDGTYTIKGEAVQKVLEAVDTLENADFDESDIESMKRGTYIYKGKFYARGSNSRNVRESISSVTTGTHIAGLAVNNLSASPSIVSGINHFNSVYNGVPLSLGLDVYVQRFRDGVLTDYYMSSSSGGIGLALESYYTPESTSYYCNYPIFSTKDAVARFLETGEGYKDALNYSTEPLFEYGKRYTGSYNGGDITVSRAVLEGIGNKIAELNETEKTTDEKLDELLDYINEENEDELGNGGGSDDDEVVGGSSWLEKIYNVLEKILEKVKSIRRWVIADTIIDGVDLFADIGDLILNLLDEPLEAVSAIGKGLSGADSLLKNKFPFSIPWDIALLVGFLAHEPVCPEFTLPLKLERYGIDEEIVLSLEEFEFISKLSRAMLTITFCYGLAQLTMKIVGMKKGD